MGDTKKSRKKYATPRHPWEKARIEEEAEITKTYALKNKKQIWKMNSLLRNFKDQAKKLSSLDTKQSEKETKQLFTKLNTLGLLTEPSLDAILNLKMEDIMERRLQTLVFKKGYARSMKQARQFIVHRHVGIGDKVITSPAHIVRKADEDKITFKAASALSNNDHPERQIAKVVEPVKEDKKAMDEARAKKPSGKKNEEAPKAEKKEKKAVAKEDPKVEKKEKKSDVKEKTEEKK